MQQFKNVHTGKVWLLLRTEVVKSFPNSILVYVLHDGNETERWNQEQLFQHHVEVEPSPDFLEESKENQQK